MTMTMKKLVLAALAGVLVVRSLVSIEIGGLSRGTTSVVTYLPVDQRTKNVGGSDGAGLCVFSSIGHAARYQNVNVLKDFQKFMRSRPGGGYPAKVDDMIQACAAQQGGESPGYLQYEGSDPLIIRKAIESGRMPCVTYDGRDPHYRQHIEHMVNVVGYSDEWVCVLDNNFIEDNQLVWLTPAEFKARWIGQGGAGRQGWTVILIGVGWPSEK